MNNPCEVFVHYIIHQAPQHNKQRVEEDACAQFHLIQDRKVFHNDDFAVRFCYARSASASFCNTVLSLSALEKYDRIPFFVVLVRQSAPNLIRLANATFIKKISHSSKKLSMTNIKGSFNGSDIMREYGGLSNEPPHFAELFALHQGLDWEDNLLRLVEASSQIVPVSQRFVPSSAEERHIYNSVSRAMDFVSSPNFSVLESDLNERCQRCSNEILIASHIENSNIRGRLIESLITSDEEERQRLIQELQHLESALPSYNSPNALGDYCRQFDNGHAYIDIKTQVIYLNSNPKAYSIDKFLRQMADSKSVFLFFFVGIDATSIFRTLLCSVFHDKLLDNTLLQTHWAGRNTRGVAQFRGRAIDEMLNEAHFTNDICIDRAKAFLQRLLDR